MGCLLKVVRDRGRGGQGATLWTCSMVSDASTPALSMLVMAQGHKKAACSGECGVPHCSGLSLLHASQKLHSGAGTVSHATSPREREGASRCALQQV